MDRNIALLVLLAVAVLILCIVRKRPCIKLTFYFTKNALLPKGTRCIDSNHYEYETISSHNFYRHWWETETFFSRHVKVKKREFV